MSKMQEVLTKDFSNKVKELSNIPLKIKQHFNTYFNDTETVMLKMQKVSRECRFDKEGIYYGDLSEKSYLIRYGSLNRGPHDEMCPIW